MEEVIGIIMAGILYLFIFYATWSDMASESNDQIECIEGRVIYQPDTTTSYVKIEP